MPFDKDPEWLIVIFGEPGLDRPLSALTCEGREETELCPPPSSPGQPSPHAHRRHGVREHVVASAWSPVSRAHACPLPPLAQAQ